MKTILISFLLAATAATAAPLDAVMVNTNGVQVAPSMLTLTNVVIQGFNLVDLADVDATGRSDGDILAWDAGEGRHEYVAQGGHDPVTLGTAPGSLTGQQYNLTLAQLVDFIEDATLQLTAVVGPAAGPAEISAQAGQPILLTPDADSGSGTVSISGDLDVGGITAESINTTVSMTSGGNPVLTTGSTIDGAQIQDGTITAAKTTITGTPTGAKYLRDDWSWQSVAGGGIGGSTGSTDNLALRSDGTGGATLQNSPLQIDDATASTQQNVALVNADAATNSALVLTPKGTGALIFGPKPNAAASGGNSRGSYAVDLQMTRASASQVASGQSATVIGVNNTASATYAIAIGTGSQATGAPGGSGQGAIAIGHGSVSSSWASYTFGESCTASAARSMALGNGATADDLYSVVVGCWNTVSSDRQYQFKIRADAGITHQNSTGTMTFWGKLTTAPVTGVNAGDIYYNTTDNKHYGYNGSTWNAFY